MKFLAALAALIASAQAGVIGLAGPALGPRVIGHNVLGYTQGTPLAGHVVPPPQVVGAVAAGPNVIPSRHALPAAYAIEEAPIVEKVVTPVEQWSLSVNW